MFVIRHFDEIDPFPALIPDTSSGKAQTRQAIPWVIYAIREIFHKF